MKNKLIFIILSLLLVSCALPGPSIPITSHEETPPTPTAGINPATGLPNFDHIALIVLENKGYASALDNTSMPHLEELAQKNVLLTNYFAIGHPSLPNYLALVSGSNQNVTSDCLDCFINQPNLADEIEKSGRTWKSYLESMPSPCFIGDKDSYTQRHNPFLYFDDIRTNTTRCGDGIVPLSQLDTDFADGQVPNFLFIMPNLCNSGHDCTSEKADQWLDNMVTKLQTSTYFGKNSLIVITFDEAENSDSASCCGLGKGGGRVATVLVSPLAKAGLADSTEYSHYSLLKTFLTAWSLPDLGKTGQVAIQPIKAPWNSNLSSQPNPTSIGNGPSNQPGQITAGCNSSSPGSGTYTVKICFTSPADGASLSGDARIAVKVDVTGAPAQVQQVLFYLDGEYLLTTFYNIDQFTLPTTKWKDGDHTLSAEAMMRDKSLTGKSSIQLVFNNGITSVPSNNNSFTPSSGIEPAAGSPFIVAAAGDGAGGGENETRVTDLIKSLDPNLFLYLGDVYERGSSTEFYNWYGTDSTFYGQFRSITNPTIGNHDFGANNGAGYFDYWNNIPDYYSYDAHGWHFISLDSNGSKVSTAAGSAQYSWLQNDLATNPLPCTIVYYHHPLFNIGTEGPTDGMADMWKLMAQYNVSIVLNGHDHDYQRWTPLNEDGQPDPKGITEFVVGTGGHGLQSFPNQDKRVAYSNNSNPLAFGALFLQLNPGGVNFSFINTENSVLDAGVIPCAGAKTDQQFPSQVKGLAANIMNPSTVNLTWAAASDDTGVAGYAIYRNGVNIAIVPSYSQEYVDSSVTASVNYNYSIAAFDLAGNHAQAAGNVKVNIPGVASFLSFPAAADTYVNATNPASNYGKTPFMRINSSPDMRGYIRFTVSGLKGRTIKQVRLLLYCNNNNKDGLNIYLIPDNKWNEMEMNYDHAPLPGGLIFTSGPLSAGTWLTIDLSQIVTGDGTYNFSLDTHSTRSINIATRESGQNAPQLIVDFQ